MNSGDKRLPEHPGLKKVCAIVASFLCAIALGVFLILAEIHGDAWAESVAATFQTWPSLASSGSHAGDVEWAYGP